MSCSRLSRFARYNDVVSFVMELDELVSRKKSKICYAKLLVKRSAHIRYRLLCILERRIRKYLEFALCYRVTCIVENTNKLLFLIRFLKLFIEKREPLTCARDCDDPDQLGLNFYDFISETVNTGDDSGYSAETDDEDDDDDQDKDDDDEFEDDEYDDDDEDNDGEDEDDEDENDDSDGKDNEDGKEGKVGKKGGKGKKAGKKKDGAADDVDSPEGEQEAGEQDGDGKQKGED